MRFLLIAVVLLVACAAPLTEEEEYARAAKEQERVEAYLQWHDACLRRGGIIEMRNVYCPRRGRRPCIPSRWDWNKATKGGSVSCIQLD